MNDPQHNYWIKPDYEPLPQAETVETSPQDYWSDARIRAVASYQYDVYRTAATILTGRDRGARALADIGCGYPSKANALLKPVADSLVLLDQPTLEGIVHRDFPDIPFVPIDLERPQATPRQVDVVVCADVLEHLLDPDPCLEFIRSLVKPEGVIVLSTPERDILRGENCLKSPKPEHVREWNRSEFRNYLIARGFKIEQHALLPEAQLNIWQQMERAIAGRLIARRAWFGCQMVICRAR